MPWKWFGVKTVFRTEAHGKPNSLDESYDAEATLVEERVVLIRARSFDEAISKAEAEAQTYASEEYRNPYGQSVKQRYLWACDAFELFDQPGAGVEVYSSTELVLQSVPDREITERRMGANETKDEERRRRKFFNAEL
jgi:uncharacterized protein DUF4288